MIIYALAQVGAFVAFIDLLQVVTPIKAAAIAPGNKTAVLSDVMIVGAIAASVSNIIFGAVSDRTTSRFGRRRPWMIAGLVGVMVSYALVALAGTPLMLGLAIVLFQIAFNMFYAPFGAVVADRVPNRQKGLVSALIGVGFAAGDLVSAGLVTPIRHGLVPGLACLGLTVMVLIAPCALALRDPPVVRHRAPFRPIPTKVTTDLVLAVLSRQGVFTGQLLMLSYMLFNIRDRQAASGWLPHGLDPEQALAQLLAVSAVTVALMSVTCGGLSDRIGHRRPFLAASGVGMAAIIAAAGFVTSWPSMLVLYALLGAAMGCYRAVDGALMVEVLPSTADAGRDLGWVNLSNTMPQMMASGLALLVMDQAHGGYRMLFLAGAVVTAVGGALALRIRNVK